MNMKTMTLLVLMTYPPVAGIFLTAFLVLDVLSVDVLHQIILITAHFSTLSPSAGYKQIFFT